MKTSPPGSLTATIKAEAFKIGPNPQPPNRFQVSITNGGEQLRRTSKSVLSLRGALGAGGEALFLDDTDVRRSVTAFPDSSGWKVTPDFSNKDSGTFALKFTTTNAIFFEKDQTLTIDVSNVISKTARGTAVLWFETGLADGQQRLSIEKLSDQPDIISFYAVPVDGAQNLPLGADVQNLPFATVTLKWVTYQLNNRQLTRDGSADPLDCDFSAAEGSKTIGLGDTDQTYRLRGYDGARLVERALTLKVLRSGWYDVKNTLYLGDPGYPRPGGDADAPTQAFDLEPTLLLNANDRRLYGIFRHAFQGERALLFRAEQPFAGWRFVPSSVPDEAGFIPRGFASSPGVFLDDKIWLIGGSQIDPDTTSNVVWRFDPAGSGEWENRGAAGWSRRMGHAVIVYHQQIWVLGGRDEAGNALNDVWSLDIANDNRTWVVQTRHAPWTPRCLLAPAVFDGKIWIYGGVKEPFSDDLYDDLHVLAGGTWGKTDMTGIITGDNDSRKPIASSLQVLNNELYLFGAFRTIKKRDKSEVVERLAFALSSPTTRTWTTVDASGLQRWGAVTTFSYQLVNFADRMLIARALAYDVPNPTLKVYVFS
jgi:hypothetical protein